MERAVDSDGSLKDCINSVDQDKIRTAISHREDVAALVRQARCLVKRLETELGPGQSGKGGLRSFRRKMGQACLKSKKDESQVAGDAAQFDNSGKETLVLRPTPGAPFAAARIRRGDVTSAYVFERKILGTGYSGPVYLVVDRYTGRKYAAKTFRKVGANNDQLQMLRNEAQVYLRLDHPHIARLIETWEDPRHAYLIIEYCSGGQLYERLCARRTYSEEDARGVAQQMFFALSYLHAHNVVHRDLKLENWLYATPDDHANLKLIDFGFSRIWSSSSSKRMHATCGTIVYVSPDTLIGGYTNACDVWSLGVVVYMLLVGYPPFCGTEEEMFARILEARYSLQGPRWSRISEEGKDFVRRLLQKDPSKRLTAREALDHPWLARANGPHQNDIALDPAVIESLRKFATRTRFERTALTLMALSLTSDRLEGMRDIFIAFDQTKEGSIRLHELETVLKAHTDLSDAEIVKIFTTLDSSNDKEVYFNDFIAAMLTHCLTLDEDLLRASFTKFDVDQSGFISFDNLRQVLGDDYSLKTLAHMFAEADASGKGMIYYEEFFRLMVGQDPQSTATTSSAFDEPFSSREVMSLKTTDVTSRKTGDISGELGTMMGKADVDVAETN